MTNINRRGFFAGLAGVPLAASVVESIPAEINLPPVVSTSHLTEVYARKLVREVFDKDASKETKAQVWREIAEAVNTAIKEGESLTTTIKGRLLPE